jgi:hypothetical protein
VRQAAGGEVPERLEGVDPDVRQDECQGLTLKKKVCEKTYLLLFCSHNEVGLNSKEASGIVETRSS